LQALDANGVVINARQFHPLFGVIASGPGGAINADVPNFGFRSLSANNFHCAASLRPSLQIVRIGLGRKNKRKTAYRTTREICQMNKRKQHADRGGRACSN
jgi:hypothetical protein